jgi:group II intron reverse transcriptase/maturase|tara:strand:+ start:685 stop:1959 length:1275 start_codon:yes stop_codon:yes gene_type:complete
MSFTSLAYLMDLDWLREAYRRTRKDGAVGIDGQSASDYERDLEANLQSLLDRAKSGRYQAPPVRRAHIPKPGSPTQTRPIGIPTLEDKLLQRAVAMLLEPIYEHDFHDSSYGFRPGRSAHQALDQLWQQLMDRHGGWIVEVDIQQFFDTLDHNHLRAFLRQRIRDGVVERLIGKWLKAGVLEEGKLFFPKAGSPQGGVISPMLANIYLHYVLDEWFEWEIKPRLKGAAYQVRYGDDFVVGCTGEDDARRLLAVLPKRFGKYGLKLHPDKTRLIPFLQPPKAVDGKSGGPGHQVRCFDLLGFTHYWGRSRKGRWVVKRKTSSERMSRALHRITQWCRYNRHRPLSEQQHLLSQKRRGHFAYYGITGNSPALSDFALRVLLIWRKWLLRRHRANARGRLRLTWLRTQYPLPSARAVHSVCPSVANP